MKKGIQFHYFFEQSFFLRKSGCFLKKKKKKSLPFDLYPISSLGQMALESTTCGIVHHARRTRAHCPTMVSSFKLSSGTVCLLGFSCRAGHIRKGKYKICGSYQVQDCTGRNGIVHHTRRMTRCCNISSLGHLDVRDAQCRSYQCSLALGRNHKSYISDFLIFLYFSPKIRLFEKGPQSESFSEGKLLLITFTLQLL